MNPRRWAVIFGLLLSACAGTHGSPAPEVRNALAPTGKLRVGVYPGSPTSLVRDPRTGEAKGLSVDLGKELANRLGVPFEQVEYPAIAQLREGMKAREVDFIIAIATPEWTRDADFTQPLLSIEFGYLVPPTSSIRAVADVDRPGVRVGATRGSTAHGALPRVLNNAEVVPVATLKQGGEMLMHGKLDAYATNKAILFEMSDNLPGSRVLDGRWGTEDLAIGVPKGRDPAMAYMRSFVDAVRSEGLVARASERAGLRGIATAKSPSR